MLPETVNRSSSATTNSEKSQPVLFTDDVVDSPQQLSKLATSDFNSHFVIKSTSSSSFEKNCDITNQIPTVTISKCPDISISVNTVNSSCLTIPNVNNLDKEAVARPATAPLHSTVKQPLASISPLSEPGSSKSPGIMAPSSSPSFNSLLARRSSSFQHPFLKSSQNPTLGSLPPGSMFDTSPRASILSFPDSPMDFNYQPVAHFCFRKNKMGNFETDEEKADSSSVGKTQIDQDYKKILASCGQREPIPIDMIFNGIKDIEKIGEGVYGEVYSGTFRYFSQCSWVYKVVAIAGDAMVNGEKQKGFMEVLPEIIVSQELSKLKGVLNKCYTDGYAFMKNARIAQGRYPGNLLQPWDQFREKYESDNDKPEFGPDQLYMVLEFEFAGQDIESLNFLDARQTLSIVLQVAHILAVGEFALEFEHRDLHWGNILVQNWQAATVRYLINGETFHVPAIGIKAAVIDFTISRVKHSKTQAPVYLDLQDDEEQFLGTGDHQFDIYRMMRDYNRNDWEGFRPKSNIFWLHYLANKLYVKGQYTAASSSTTNRRSVHHLQAINKLRDFSYTILEHESAKDFVMSKESRAYREFLGLPVPPPVVASSTLSAKVTPQQ